MIPMKTLIGTVLPLMCRAVVDISIKFKYLSHINCVHFSVYLKYILKKKTRIFTSDARLYTKCIHFQVDLNNIYKVWSESSRPHELRNIQEWKVCYCFQYNLPSSRCTFSILFQFACLLKIEVFILVPKYSFTTSMTPSLIPKFLPRRLVSALETDRSQKGLNLENTGDRIGLRSRIQSMQPWQLRRVSSALSCKSKTPRVNFPLLFLLISWRSRLCSTYYVSFIVRPSLK